MSSILEIVITAVILVLILKSGRAQLQVGFYDDSCAAAELIVREGVEAAFIDNDGVAAGLIRLHFHDCFVRGCDGSVLIDTVDPDSPAEKEARPNKPSLRGFETVDSIKTRLEAACPGVVSCADILAFAARDSIEITGGIGYAVSAGRRDGSISLAEEAKLLPSPFENLDNLTQKFASKGLSQQEMVALSGAHTLGRSHCSSFRRRLYEFNSSSGSDPTLDAAYAWQLKQQCPKGGDGNEVVEIDVTPATFDAAYYRGLLKNRGLFTSDETLLTDPNIIAQASLYAQDPLLWKKDFAAAMVHMGYIEVLSGSDGEIRKNCRVINN